MNSKNKRPAAKINPPLKGRPPVDYDKVPFGCAICNRGFSTIQSLNAHAFRDHRISAKLLVTSGRGKAPSGTFGGLSKPSVPRQVPKRTSSDVEPAKHVSGRLPSSSSSKKPKLTPVTEKASGRVNGNETVTSGNSSSHGTSSSARNEPRNELEASSARNDVEEPETGVGLITDPELKMLVEKRDGLEAAVAELHRKIKNLATLEKVHKRELKRLKEQAKLLQEKVSQTKIQLHSDSSENGTKDATSHDEFKDDAGIKVEPKTSDDNPVITMAGSLGHNDSPIGSPNGHVEQVTAGPSSKMVAPNTNEGEKDVIEDLKAKFTEQFSRGVGAKNFDKPEKVLAEIIGNVTRFQKDLQEFVLDQMETTKKKIREMIKSLEEKQAGLKKETYDGLKKLEQLKEDIEKMKKFVECLQQALHLIKE